jgi:methionyl-tRNA formyltransferase
LNNSVVILASGQLGFHVLNNFDTTWDINAIGTDKNSADVIEFAKSKNIPLFIGNPRGGKLAFFLMNFKSNILFSVNYLFLLEKDSLDLFKFPLNIHGSLLPKYRGRSPHIWAIINNEKKTGITTHIIDNGCDTGKIIFQKEIDISNNDTGYSILQKYFKYYPEIIKNTLEIVSSGKISLITQNEKYATKFGKRTPADGKINWEWQKERIYNWVRALSNPYPGAFTFYKNKRLVIDEIKYCEFGYDSILPNGIILSIKPNIIVKTPNGLIEIIKFREDYCLDFTINEFLE